MNDPLRRPWWNRKRWRLAAGGLFVLAYPATEGPMSYAMARRWLPHTTYDAIYVPVWAAVEDSPLQQPHDKYVWWWESLGYRHEGYDVRSLGGVRILSRPAEPRLRVR